MSAVTALKMVGGETMQNIRVLVLVVLFMAMTTTSMAGNTAPRLFPDDRGLEWNFDEHGDGMSDPPEWGRTRYRLSINPVIENGVVTVGAHAGADKVAGRIFPSPPRSSPSTWRATMVPTIWRWTRPKTSP